MTSPSVDSSLCDRLIRFAGRTRLGKTSDQWHCLIRLIDVAAWCYLVAMIGVWLTLRVGGDRWWLPTVMLFGPKWLCAMPLVALVPLAAAARRRALRPLLAAALIVVGPMMGLCIPWARVVGPRAPSLRVLTCNLKGQCDGNQALDALLEDTRPDVVALQGCWREVRVKWPAGWHVWQEGPLLVASRYPLRATQQRPPAPLQRGTGLLHFRIAAPQQEIDFCCVHLQSPHRGFDHVLDGRTVLRPSGSDGLVANIHSRWSESALAAGWLEGLSSSLIAAGDFNMPTESAIYRHYWNSYYNAFSESGFGFGYTEWPRIRRRQLVGIRIDHVLAGPSWRPYRCWVGPDVGSDHLPLIADLCWQGS